VSEPASPSRCVPTRPRARRRRVWLFRLIAVALTLAPDSDIEIERVKTRLRQRYASLSPLDQKIFADLSLDAIHHNLLVAMAGGYRAAGREDLAQEMLRRHRLRRPWETPASGNADESPGDSRGPKVESQMMGEGPMSKGK
jgi:hypothetical protein